MACAQRCLRAPAARRARRHGPAEALRASPAPGAAGRDSRRRSRARSSTSRRCCAATAASCAPTWRADLDEARALRDDSRKVMAALEARYVEATGIKSLKVRHNNILGFYVEVPAAPPSPAERAACADLPASPDDGWRHALHHG
jgi:DNA mismatch repair protein MutS